MRATIMYAAGDVRVENVPDATISEPTDAVVRVTRACICGSDLRPYLSMQAGQSMGDGYRARWISASRSR
jgi:threonine dehydrogenase-like Zn-dependent dehydrogenase